MSKREIGNEYRVGAMSFLARAGYASTRQIALAVWKGCDMSSRKMASRTLRWLRGKGYIVTKREGGSVNGEQLSALTAAGAAWIAENGEPLPGGKAHARDWLRHAHPHRTACNSVYAGICGDLRERVSWSELEVRAKIAPLHQFAYTFEGVQTVKIPDLVAIHVHGGYQWIEVENAWRSETDLKKMVACLRAMFYDSRQTRFACAHFVITAPGAKTIGERLRRAMTHGPDSGWPRQIKELDARILAERIKVSTLDRETLELTRVFPA